MSQRGDDGGGEHEASRRMKTELLIQMDGLARSQELVFVLAGSILALLIFSKQSPLVSRYSSTSKIGEKSICSSSLKGSKDRNAQNSSSISFCTIS